MRFAVLAAVLALASCNRVEIRGGVQKIRVYGNGENPTAVVVDFRLRNQASIPLVVGDVEVILDLPDGRTVSGSTVSDGDSERFLLARPEQGPKYNPALTRNTKVRAGEEKDFMIAASFDAPESEIQGRKDLRIRVHDLDGPTFEFGR